MNKSILQEANNVLLTLAGDIRKSLLSASDSFNVDLVSPPVVNRNGLTNVKYSVYVTSSNIDRTVIDTIIKAVGDVDKDKKVIVSILNISMVGDSYADNNEYFGYRIDVTVEMRYISYLHDLKYENSKVSKEYKILHYLINKLSLNDAIESITIDKYNDVYMNVDIGCGISKTALLFNLYKFETDSKFDIDEVRTICRNILGSSYVGLVETSKLDGTSYIRNTVPNQLRYTLLADWSKYDRSISPFDERIPKMSIAFNDLIYVVNSKISLMIDLAELSTYHVSLELSYDKPTDVIHNVFSDVSDIVVNTLDIDADKIRITPVEVTVSTSRSIIVDMNINIDE